ncbi:hypothetical protein CR3_gp035 [Cronobacter phage CR3]|uniref:Uncharacterized protein n=1 Tax=Cronobacter phage CR3 TaxID=1162295 RepID=I1TR77_9CAUD|nr:hypothetical protein CR3_gp035 [Cronobacter phage CR3]AFH21200.1 hypothetical protein CR3_035 [Cronobacter phage CR3]
MSDVKVITEVVNPIDNSTVSLAVGTIERINIKRINEDGSPKITPINKGPNKGKTIVATHRASLLVKNGEDQVWISFGTHEVKNMKYESQYQVKEGEVWVDLKPGMAIRVPVQIRKWTDNDGNERSAPEGKKSKIVITDKSGARDAAPAGNAGGSQTSSAPSNASGGKTTKVYGEILSLSDTGALVKDENGNEVSVVLNKEQIAQVQVGGRLAGQRAEDGTLSGFKAYGPKGSAGAGAGGSKGGFKKDNSGMETGHALNGALNLRRSGLTIPPVVEVAKVVHDVTKHLKLDAANDPANKGMSDYDLGAMVGHAVLNATRDIQVGENDNPEEITGKLLAYARGLMSEVVPGVSAYVKGEQSSGGSVAQTAQSQPDPKLDPKPETQQSAPATSSNGHIDMTPPEVDFDDDIPF